MVSFKAFIAVLAPIVMFLAVLQWCGGQILFWKIVQGLSTIACNFIAGLEDRLDALQQPAEEVEAPVNPPVDVAEVAEEVEEAVHITIHTSVPEVELIPTDTSAQPGPHESQASQVQSKVHKARDTLDCCSGSLRELTISWLC